MRFGYYPGCSLSGSAREYDESMRAIAGPLGIELVEIPDWNCCGATAAHNIDHLMSLALPARTLALAEKHGLDDILVPCSACYNRLATTRHEIATNESVRKVVSDVLQMPLTGKARVLNILEALVKVFAEKPLKPAKPLGFKVACYYGCYLVRPPKLVNFDRPEDPQSMDEMMKALGAVPIDWPFKVECCGAGFSVTRTDIVAKLSGHIVEDAVRRGAEAIVTVCPMCHSNLDMRRDHIEKLAGKSLRIPVLYITQAIGLAMGVSRSDLGLHRHLVPVPEDLVRAAPEPAAKPQAVATGGK